MHYKAFYSCNPSCIKLDCFLFSVHPCLKFAGKAGAFLNSGSYRTPLLALPGNIILRWNGHIVTNTAAFYNAKLITSVKSL